MRVHDKRKMTANYPFFRASSAMRFFEAAHPQIGQVDKSCPRAGQYSRPK